MFDEQAGPVVPSGQADPVSSTGYTESVIESVAVLGAGVMGAQIAPISPTPASRAPPRRDTRRRSQGAAACALAEARPVLHRGHVEAGHDRRFRGRHARPSRGRFDHRGGRRADCNQAGISWPGWTGLERPGSMVASNTSGIPIAALAEGRSDDFRRHWLGTHFFNPPRYLHLLEVIPTPEDPAGRNRRGLELCRSAPRQRRGHCPRFARVHRQPSWPLRDWPHLGQGRRGRVHHRGGRRDHRPGDWTSEERDVSNARPGRARYLRLT